MKKIAILSFIVSFILGCATAQDVELRTDSRKAKRYFKDAKEYIENRQIDMAIDATKEATVEDPDFLDAWVLLSEIYHYEKKFDKKEKALREVVRIDPKFEPGYFIQLANLSYRDGRYKKAKNDLIGYTEHTNNNPDKNEVYLDLKKRIDFAVNAVENPVDYNPKNLGRNVNTKYDDYWPSLTADEERLVTTVLIPAVNRRGYNTGRYQEDLFESVKDKNGEWQRIRNMGKVINSRENEGAQCISVDGKYCIFTGCNRKNGYGSCDLYMSYRRGNKWDKPINLGGKVNSRFWESNPSLSADGKWLYYSSSDTSGYGRNDIWRVKIKEGMKFGKPENLGPVVNTKGADASPFIHPDGKTLYYSSNGRIGMGNFDMYVTRLQEDGSWSEPENMGYPINTHKEERSLIVNTKGNLALMASEREDSYGGMDIYQFEIPEDKKPNRVTYVKGKVYDAETEEPVEAYCRLLDPESGKVVAVQKSNMVDGTYLVCLPIGKEYAFNVDKTGYMFYSDNFSLENYDDPDKAYVMDIPLQPIKKGQAVVLKNIFFEFDKYDLKKESMAELSKLTEFMRKNPGVSIEISGHTDNKGSESYNKTLSKNRAKSVYDHLIKKGIDKERLTYKGYGQDEPIADNSTDEGRAKNRRTEFKIIEIKK